MCAPRKTHAANKKTSLIHSCVIEITMFCSCSWRCTLYSHFQRLRIQLDSSSFFSWWGKAGVSAVLSKPDLEGLRQDAIEPNRRTISLRSQPRLPVRAKTLCCCRVLCRRAWAMNTQRLVLTWHPQASGSGAPASVIFFLLVFFLYRLSLSPSLSLRKGR